MGFTFYYDRRIIRPQIEFMTLLYLANANIQGVASGDFYPLFGKRTGRRILKVPPDLCVANCTDSLKVVRH